MSTEQESLNSGSSDAFELPADGQDQELDGDKQESCVIAEPGASSAADLGTTKEKESVNGGSDLVSGTTKESEKKKEASVNCAEEVNGEKDSGGIQRELVVSKEEEPDIECFMGLEPYESKNEIALDDDNAPVTLKAKLSESDLVWAKVRSHPWWPGQVFDASAASEKAKKHFKKGSFLVTYFGDCSFAWNDASKIKPFRQHFSQMAKQSSLPGFLDAIDFALEEVSRRVEFGLACSCISEEVYEKVKTQKVINPGIREESSRVHGGDKVSGVVFFEPVKLVEYVKRLACSPSYDDELEFVSQRARLLAFNRWKGYNELPEFETLQGSVESAVKMTHTEKESRLSEVKESAPEAKESKQVYTKRRKTEEKDQCKPDGVFEYEDTTTTVPKKKKKEKTLAEFIAEKRLSKSSGKKRSHENSDGEKKRKVVHSKPLKSAKKTKTEGSGSPSSLKSAKKTKTEDSGSLASPKNDEKITPKKAKTSFGIGASILRVANQMHCSSPTTGLVSCSKNNGSGKSKPEALSEREPSPNETLSSRRSASTTKASSGKANPISIDKVKSGELERVVKETPSTDLVEDSRELKGSSEEQMVNEDRKEDANIVGNKNIEEKITGSDLKVKEQHVNKNSPDGSAS